MLKSWHSTKFINKFDDTRFMARQAYFDDARDFLLSHYFKTNIEKEVWRLHSEGLSLREIAKEAGSLSKDGAMKIIKSLAIEMKSPTKNKREPTEMTEEQKNKLLVTYGYLLALEVPPEIVTPLKELLLPEKKKAS